MVKRLIKPLNTRSFFIFGPRGVGKSTWLRENLDQHSIYINLLDPESYEEYSMNPQRFKDFINLPENTEKIIIIDEIQKIPILLDIIHDEISKNKKIFVLSGSSARKLKQKGVNLLAGRASVYNLYPFSMLELEESFNLEKSLERGLLPESYFANSNEESTEYLKSYVFTYIEKEIQQEQWVRKLEPFRRFLQIAAQMNTKIINKSKIAQQVGVQSSTIEDYYEILEDTLLGFRIPGFETSIRRQVRLADKFYFIDTGIARAIEKMLSVPMIEHTSYYGVLFENFIVTEIKKMIEYNRLDFTMSYLMTKENQEIDLILQLPQNKLILIKIKSSKIINESDLGSITNLGSDLDKKMKKISKKILISQDPINREILGVQCLFYKNAFDIKNYC